MVKVNALMSVHAWLMYIQRYKDRLTYMQRYKDRLTYIQRYKDRLTYILMQSEITYLPYAC